MDGRGGLGLARREEGGVMGPLQTACMLWGRRGGTPLVKEDIWVGHVEVIHVPRSQFERPCENL